MSLLAWLKETHSRVLKLLAMVFHPLEKMKCREKEDFRLKCEKERSMLHFKEVCLLIGLVG